MPDHRSWSCSSLTREAFLPCRQGFTNEWVLTASALGLSALAFNRRHPPDIWLPKSTGPARPLLLEPRLVGFGG